MIVTSVQIKTAKTQKHLYCPVFTMKKTSRWLVFFGSIINMVFIRFYNKCWGQVKSLATTFMIKPKNSSFAVELIQTPVAIAAAAGRQSRRACCL